MIRPTPFALILALLAATLLVGTATAGKPKVESKLTYKNSFDDEDVVYIHEGEIKSDLRKRARGRMVRLYAEGVDESIAGDRTNSDGEYRITLDGDGIVGDYYTRVPKTQAGSVTCKGAESKHKPLVT